MQQVKHDKLYPDIEKEMKYPIEEWLEEGKRLRLEMRNRRKRNNISSFIIYHDRFEYPLNSHFRRAEELPKKGEIVGVYSPNMYRGIIFCGELAHLGRDC